MNSVYIEKIDQGVEAATRQILKRMGGAQDFLKSSGEVYIKVNGVDSQAHTYTTPEFVATVVRAFRAAGAKRVVVMENSTQGNFTRVVFAATGMSAAVRAAGGETLCLDEESCRPVELPGGPFSRPVTKFPATILEIIERRDEVTYVNLPKFKTHSMTDVSLGLKNHWGFPVHNERIVDHNFRLQAKIAAINSLITPDLTIIEGEEAIIHGHFPPLALAERCVVPVNVLIGGRNVVATDMVGATILGFDPEKVEHIRLAADAATKVSEERISFDKIEIHGELPKSLDGEADLLDEFPTQVRVIAGKKRSCREGCRGNSLAALQILAYDHERNRDFSLVFGKGHDLPSLLSSHEDLLIVGDCAIAELGDELLGQKNRKILISSGCNNLAETLAGFCSLLEISFLSLLPMNMARTLFAVAGSVVGGTNSNLVPLRPVRLSRKRIDLARQSVQSIENTEARLSNP
jgi:uncharacterized protein (DUF362 family)